MDMDMVNIDMVDKDMVVMNHVADLSRTFALVLFQRMSVMKIGAVVWQFEICRPPGVRQGNVVTIEEAGAWIWPQGSLAASSKLYHATLKGYYAIL